MKSWTEYTLSKGPNLLMTRRLKKNIDFFYYRFYIHVILNQQNQIYSHLNTNVKFLIVKSIGNLSEKCEL